ncbi:MAG: hypothetical protein L0H53_12370 [Candidatus Nitrosocosmicus sp.]|nr:hypothetical protein [Candidatus Nitrosocosmicus sp.]
MPGLLISALSVTVEKQFYSNVIRQIYLSLNHAFLLRSPFIGSNNNLICLLCCRDAKSLNQFVKELFSLRITKKVETFIVTNIEYYSQIVEREIEKKLIDKSSKIRIPSQTLPNNI